MLHYCGVEYYLELGLFWQGSFDEVDLISLSLVSRLLGDGGFDEVSLQDLNTSVTGPWHPGDPEWTLAREEEEEVGEVDLLEFLVPSVASSPGSEFCFNKDFFWVWFCVCPWMFFWPTISGSFPDCSVKYCFFLPLSWASLTSAKNKTLLFSLSGPPGPVESLHSWSSCSELLLRADGLVNFDAPSSSMDFPLCATTRTRCWSSGTGFMKESSVAFFWELTLTYSVYTRIISHHFIQTMITKGFGLKMKTKSIILTNLAVTFSYAGNNTYVSYNAHTLGKKYCETGITEIGQFLQNGLVNDSFTVPA